MGGTEKGVYKIARKSTELNNIATSFVFADSKLHSLCGEIMKIWFALSTAVPLIFALGAVHANHEADPLCFNIFLFSNFTLAQCNSSFSQYLVCYNNYVTVSTSCCALSKVIDYSPTLLGNFCGVGT